MTDGHTQRLDTALAAKYRLERKLGEGGMASVYLAEDIKHERKVALKILRPELAAVIGAERFLSEIKTTANLQHPHILPLFDSGEANSYLYYVMPFIDGETLRERIEREGQLGVDESIKIARDVADALDYAHRAGVIHRDIKPANILLHDGRPVVADFGIALAISAAGGGRMTETGLSLGTPHYMSPEQASADRDLSARSDVYSLGCVLYEMLAGQPPHTGPSAQSILVRILTEDPRPLSELRRTVPPNVAATVMKSIEKLPADRFDTAREFRDALEDASFDYSPTTRKLTSAPAPVAAAPAAGAPKALVRGLAAALVVATGLGAWGWLRPAPEAPTAVFQIDTQDLIPVSDIVVSPDGSMLAMAAVREGVRSLYVRRLDESRFREIPGTDAGAAPEFSPDGRYLVYRDGNRDALLRIATAGGGALPLVETDGVNPYDPHWGEDGTIVFTSPQGLWRIPSTGEGGAVMLSPELSGRNPHVLPDGSGVLASHASAAIHVFDFEADSSRQIIPEGEDPIYLKTGHVAYVHPRGGLFVVPFDLGTLSVTGPAARVLDGVVGGGGSTGYSISRGGTISYREGGLGGFAAGRHQLLFLDRGGRPDTVRLPPRGMGTPRLSPDGGKVAFTDNEVDQVFTYDLATGATQQLTFEGAARWPVWSPDGSRLAFRSLREGSEGEDVYVKAADGRTPAAVVRSMPGDELPVDWPTEDVLVIGRYEAAAGDDLFLLSPAGDSDAVPYLQAEWDEQELAVHPGGAWAAYVSSEAGEPAVFVRGFPEPLGQWRISPAEGRQPRWSPDGRTLYYWTVEGEAGIDNLMAVPVTADSAFSFGVGEELFGGNYLVNGGWDVHPDGERFLVLQRLGAVDDNASDTQPERRLVILNWFKQLEELLGGN